MTRPMPARRHVRGPRHASLGMSLTEVLVSTVIFAVGVLGLFGTHAAAFNSFSDAKYRVDASLLADRLISEMWVDRANVALYAYAGHGSTTQARLTPWLTEVQQQLPSSDAVVMVNGTEVTVMLTWQPRNGDRRTYSAVATLQEP